MSCRAMTTRSRHHAVLRSDRPGRHRTHFARAGRFRHDVAPRRIRREEIPVAPQPAGFQGLAGPRGAADDLKKLTGVSGTIEKSSNDLGIFHYWQLAELDHDTAHRSAKRSGFRAEPMAGWPRPRR